MTKKMKAVLKKPHSGADIIEIGNTLEDIRGAVGGYFQAFMYSKEYNVIMICDEAGKIKGLDYNFDFGCDFIVGNVLFVSADDEDIRGLDKRQIDFLLNEFNRKKGLEKSSPRNKNLTQE